MKKLTLSKETVRNLQQPEMYQVQGGSWVSELSKQVSKLIPTKWRSWISASIVSAASVVSTAQSQKTQSCKVFSGEETCTCNCKFDSEASINGN